MNGIPASEVAGAALRRSVPFVLCAAFSPGAFAQVAPFDSALYVLTERSAYEVGCFGPCACPIRSHSFQGSFWLRFVGVDPLYANYAVERLSAIVLLDGKSVPVRGNGEYRIGGEFALVQELKLDLVIGDHGPQSFDSGLVPGGAEFPAAIVATAAAHGFACFDTVLEVSAKRSTVGVPDRGTGGFAVRALPNPFRLGTELRFVMPAPSLADVSILDVHGREVRSLARGARLDAGPQRLVWDGRAEDGTRVRPGLYFARLRSRDAAWTRRLVRLD